MKRPALGHLLGYTALTVILTAGAAQSLSGSNTVFTDDIVDNNITAADLGTNSVSRAKIQDNAIGAPEVLNNSLTGDDINEGTLGVVPQASKVNGVTISSFRGAMPEGGSPVSMFDIGDLSGFAHECSASGVRLQVGSGINRTFIAEFHAPPDAPFGPNFYASGASIDTPAHEFVRAYFETRGPAGEVVQIEVTGFHIMNFGGSDDCFFHGTITRLA